MKTSNIVLENVNNRSNIMSEIDVPRVILIIGGAAVGAYVGFQIGGPEGAAIGALVGAFVGVLAVGMIKRFVVRHKQNGEVEIEFETVFA